MNKAVYIAVDGRTSIDINGVKYSISENTDKYIIHNDNMYVTFGCGDIVKLIQI